MSSMFYIFSKLTSMVIVTCNIVISKNICYNFIKLPSLINYAGAEAFLLFLTPESI